MLSTTGDALIRVSKEPPNIGKNFKTPKLFWVLLKHYRYSHKRFSNIIFTKECEMVNIPMMVPCSFGLAFPIEEPKWAKADHLAMLLLHHVKQNMTHVCWVKHVQKGFHFENMTYVNM
jgi:hypothetical protein